MAKYQLMVQAAIDGEAVWQSTVEVPKEMLRRMTQEELEKMGAMARLSLGEVVKVKYPLFPPKPKTGLKIGKRK